VCTCLYKQTNHNIGHINRGFTLIELTVILVVLGILAVTVAPKYINFSSDAENSVLNGVKHSMQGAAQLIYSKAVVKGVQSLPSASYNTVNTESGAIAVAYGYPLANDSNFQNLLALGTDFSFAALGSPAGASVAVYFSAKPTPTSTSDNCLVVYTLPTSAGASLSINLNPCL
jgi:MSHA pilin protein MshA